MAVVGSGLSRHLESQIGCRDDFGGWLRPLQKPGTPTSCRKVCKEVGDETRDVWPALGIWARRGFEVGHLQTHHASSIGVWEGQVEWTCISIFEFDKGAPPGVPGLHIVVPPCLHAWSVGLAVHSQSGCFPFTTTPTPRNCVASGSFPARKSSQEIQRMPHRGIDHQGSRQPLVVPGQAADVASQLVGGHVHSFALMITPLPGAGHNIVWTERGRGTCLAILPCFPLTTPNPQTGCTIWPPSCTRTKM